MKRTALFAGSFDPYTNGHHSVVRKAAALFDEVVILIGVNVRKTRLSDPEASPDARTGLYSLSQKLPSERLALTALLEKARLAARDLLAARLTENAGGKFRALFYPTPEAALEAAGTISAPTLSHTLDIFEETIQSLSMNVNVYAAETAMLTSMISA